MLKNHQIITISWSKAQNDNSISAFDWVKHKHRLGLLNMYKRIIPMLSSPTKDHVFPLQVSSLAAGYMA